jgi:hypothetical protein
MASACFGWRWPAARVRWKAFTLATPDTAYIALSDTGRLGTMQWATPGLKLNFG